MLGSSNATMTPQEAVRAFFRAMQSVVGFYYDTNSAYHNALKEMKQQREKAIEMFKVTNPEFATHDYLDRTSHIYGDGDPNDPNSRILHMSTQRQARERIEEGGANVRTLRNTCVVMIYQYWEDHFRELIANSVGLKKEDLKCPIMGDLPRIRRSVIHRAGRAIPEIKSNEVLRRFKPDEVIFSREDEFDQIVLEIRSFLGTLDPTFEAALPTMGTLAADPWAAAAGSIDSDR